MSNVATSTKLKYYLLVVKKVFITAGVVRDSMTCLTICELVALIASSGAPLTLDGFGCWSRGYSSAAWHHVVADLTSRETKRMGVFLIIPSHASSC